MSGRTIALFSAAVISAYAFGGIAPWRPQSDALLTITLPAMPVSKALERLSVAAGQSFLASPQTASDVIALRLKDVPVQLAMQRIAETVDGAWRAEGGAFRLVRTADQQRAERNIEFGLDVARLRDAIQRSADDIKKMPAWSTGEAEDLARRAQEIMTRFSPSQPRSGWYQEAASVTQEAPAGRIMEQIAAQLDPQELASAPMFYKTVWSSNPTQMQRPLPQNLTPLIQDFLRAQMEWVAAADRHNLKDSVNGLGNYWLGGFNDPSNLTASSAATVLLSATRYGPNDDMTLALSVFDERGLKVGEAQMSLAGRSSGDIQALGGGATQADEPAIVFDEQTRLILEATPKPGRQSVALPRELIQKLANPDQFDPLSFTVSPELEQVAELKGVNMVACLPDMSIFGSLMGSGTGLRVSQVLRNLTLYQTVSEFKDGWLVVKPLRPDEARIYRADRSALGSYLQRLLTGKPLSLDESASYSARLPEGTINGLPAAMAKFLHGGDQGISNRLMLRLYGLLSPDQRQRMLSGGLPLSSLTESEQSLVGRLIYGPNSNIQFNAARFPDARSSAQQAQWMLFNSGLMHEATESLPTGIPPQGLLHMSRGASQVVMRGDASSSPGAGSTMMNPQSLAWAKYSQERPDLFPWVLQSGQQFDLRDMEFGPKEELTFTFELAPNLSVVESLQGRGDGEFQKVTLDSLPDDFKKQFDQAYQNLKHAYANMTPGQIYGPPGGAPPP